MTSIFLLLTYLFSWLRHWHRNYFFYERITLSTICNHLVVFNIPSHRCEITAAVMSPVYRRTWHEFKCRPGFPYTWYRSWFHSVS